MKIGFATTDWAFVDEVPTPGGAGFARCWLPARALAAMGHTVEVGMLSMDPKTHLFGIQCFDPEGEPVKMGKPGQEFWVKSRNKFGFDVIVMQRWMLDQVREEMPKAKAQGQLIVNDVDDWFFGVDRRNRAAKWMDPKLSPTENARIYGDILSMSDTITASTPWLRDRLQGMYPHVDVVLLPNRLDASRFDMRAQADRPTIGWVGGIPWRSGDLETMKGILGPFVERHDLQVVHAGAVPPRRKVQRFHELVGVDKERVTEIPMCSTFEYPLLLEHFDVGLVPLNVVDFNRAKSAIKGLEYAAAGIPFVAQSIDAYEQLRTEHHIGRTARKANLWRRHLEELLDPDTRKAEAVLQRERVEGLDIRYRAVDWEAAYRNVIDRSLGIDV